jgi:UDP-GlcNAc:undecaprenyl-phosphate GlcNAc-1-phosphate transferase
MIWFVLSFGFTFLSSLVLINRAPVWGFVDFPEERKVHTVPTPRTGGIAMACATLATFAVYLGTGHSWPPIPWQTIAAGTGFMSLGILDDRYGFHPRGKLRWFILLGLLASWPWAFHGPAGAPYIIHLGNWVVQAPRWVAYPILAVWFVSVPNAVNIEDAIDGYMGGFTLILLVVAAILGVNVLMPAGALVGFLLLNWPKAKHFLGDAGSFGCGFVIAEALLRAGGDHRPLLALVLTAPISMDVCMGIIRRIHLKMSLFEADRATCPHHVANLCHQSHALATPILWANAAVIALLAFRPAVFEAGYLCLYFLALVGLNRTSLFHPQAALTKLRPRQTRG